MRNPNFVWGLLLGLPIMVLPNSLSAKKVSGLYAGVDLGLGLGSSRYHTNSACALNSGGGTFCSSGGSEANGLAVTNNGSGKLKLTGGDLGAHIGFNWNKNCIVYGGEVDFGWFNLNKFKSTHGLFPVEFLGNQYTLTESINVNWLGTIRGRLGALIRPAFLSYVTSGIAFTDFEFSSSYSDNAVGFGFPGGTGNGSQSKNKAGWIIGAGAEWMLRDCYSIKAEYYYIDFNSTKISVPTSNTPAFTQVMQINANLKTNILRIGINYWF